MSQLDTIVKWTKKIESALEKQLGAEGRGLHEKTSSVQQHLDARLVKLLRRIATIRNKSMHEEDYQVEDIKRFIEDCDTAHKQIIAIGNGKNLREVPAGKRRCQSPRRQACFPDQWRVADVYPPHESLGAGDRSGRTSDSHSFHPSLPRLTDGVNPA